MLLSLTVIILRYFLVLSQCWIPSPSTAAPLGVEVRGRVERGCVARPLERMVTRAMSLALANGPQGYGLKLRVSRQINNKAVSEQKILECSR